jgi:hypothetical protein
VGVGVGEAVGEGVGVGEGVADGEAVGVGDGEAVGSGARGAGSVVAATPQARVVHVRNESRARVTPP